MRGLEGVGSIMRCERWGPWLDGGLKALRYVTGWLREIVRFVCSGRLVPRLESLGYVAISIIGDSRDTALSVGRDRITAR